MAHYAISGVWKDTNGTITDYAIHNTNVEKNAVDNPAKKYSKTEAIKLLYNSQNSAQTLLWNYKSKAWTWGTSIIVVNTGTNKYLRTIQDEIVRDNLDHLINYTFVASTLS
ncbi:DUF3892 domain-containing protein [uncultured Chryseobacterium sp.]|uniref:DUF3892 domain-containing protein n=1 Tax=uncultured Chryseobacterium sp. TaxID=259322 RepID=UPI0025D14147|nr:DUF3892 domain-containing protein [uncultured Chryseobacterium sp.]